MGCVVALAVVVSSGLVKDARDAGASAAAFPLDSCASSDHGAPVAEVVTLDRRRIDVRRHGRSVVVDAVLRDTGGPGPALGVKSATARATPEGGSGERTAAMRRLEGDHWRGVLRFPRGVRPGVWAVTVTPVDEGGLYAGRFIDSPSTPQVRMLRVVAREDSKAPVATAVSLSAGSVDVRDSDRRVRVAVAARDALSGVASVLLSLSRDDQRVFVTRQADLRLVTGSAHGGRWQGHVRLPRLSPGGWWVAGITVVDRAGRVRTYRSNFEGSRPNPAGLRSVRVLSVRDRLPPETTEITASAGAIDLRSAPATVTIQARIRDAGSGVASASAAIMLGSIFEYEVPLRLVSGGRADGTWRGSWTAATCQIQAGVRTIRVLARDRADARDLSGAAGPSLDVQNDDHTGPWVTASEVAATSASVTFSEDVHGITPTSAFLRDPSADITAPAITGTWRCVDETGNPVDCQEGPVRTARFLPHAPFAALYLRLVINPEHVLDVTDGSGNPYLSGSTNLGYPPRG